MYTTTIVESCWNSMIVGDQLASLALAALAKVSKEITTAKPLLAHHDWPMKVTR